VSVESSGAGEAVFFIRKNFRKPEYVALNNLELGCEQAG
jgi:hypothetical protein